MQKADKEQWFVLRISYGRETAIKAILEGEGHRTFIPMKYVRTEKNGKVSHEWVPAVGNLLFVNATHRYLYDFILGEGDRRRTHFMWNRSDHKPIVVPDKQMEDFIRVCSASNEEVLYLSDLSAKLRNGAKVRVSNGPFLGVEGTVVRIKKSRRIMVEIPGIIAAASAYIPMEDLELIEN